MSLLSRAELRHEESLATTSPGAGTPTFPTHGVSDSEFDPLCIGCVSAVAAVC